MVLITFPTEKCGEKKKLRLKMNLRLTSPETENMLLPLRPGIYTRGENFTVKMAFNFHDTNEAKVYSSASLTRWFAQSSNSNTPLVSVDLLSNFFSKAFKTINVLQ